MSASLGVWCELVCNTCAATTAGRWVFSYSIPRSRMLDEAKASGWERRGRDVICPDCITEER